MNYKRFNLSFIASIVLTVAGLVSVNWYYDFYGIFGEPSGKPAINLNQRFSKVQFLTEPEHQFNAFLLGSSRVGHFNVDYMNETAQAQALDYHFYNLSVFSGAPTDYLKLTEFLIETQPVKTLWIGLDLYPFFMPPDLTKAEFLHHPRITEQPELSFYLSYLFRSSPVLLATDHAYFFAGGLPPYEHNTLDGSFRPVRSIAALESDYDRYWAAEAAKAEKGAANFRARDHHINAEQTEALRKLAELLRNHAIDARFFINPRHPLNNAYYSPETLSRFIAMLDETGVTPLLVDIKTRPVLNSDFYDLMHYKPHVAAQMTREIMATMAPLNTASKVAQREL